MGRGDAEEPTLKFYRPVDGLCRDNFWLMKGPPDGTMFLKSIFLLLLLALPAVAIGPKASPACSLALLAAREIARANGNAPGQQSEGEGSTVVKHVDGDKHIEVIARESNGKGEFFTKYIYKLRRDGQYDVERTSIHENGAGVELSPKEVVSYIAKSAPVSFAAVQKAGLEKQHLERYRARLEKEFIATFEIPDADFAAIKKELAEVNAREARGWGDSEILSAATTVALQRKPEKVVADYLIAGIRFSHLSKADFMAQFEGRNQFMDTVFDPIQARYRDSIGVLNAKPPLPMDVAKWKAGVLSQVIKSGILK